MTIELVLDKIYEYSLRRTICSALLRIVLWIGKGKIKKVTDGKFHWENKEFLKMYETTLGNWTYHLSWDGKTCLCGENDILRKELPLKNWGFVSHLRERYCHICNEREKAGGWIKSTTSTPEGKGFSFRELNK